MTSQYCAAKEILVANIDEFYNAIKDIQPGDHVILKNGEWNNAHIIINAKGLQDLPITIEAETSGKVILTGDSYLKMAGQFIVVKGLWFKDGFTSEKAVLSFRKNSKEFATNSRITECAVTNYNPTTKTQKYQYVDFWGKNNRLDHNYFKGKTNNGPILVVWLKGDDHIDNNHIIEYNHFAGRPPLGTNGGETIRIGTSQTSLSSSRTIVQNNTFEKCNGEVEIISNKSCDNIFRNNLFLESEGILTLRHGNRALVEGNVFIGNQKPKTGGIRVINAGHIIRNNLMIGLAGSDFRSSLVIMNGVPNSPANRYHQVNNVDIQNNTIIDSSPIQLCAGKDEERTLAPINTVFANNIISNSNGGTIAEAFDNLQGFTFSGNYMDENNSFEQEGFKKTAIQWDLVNQSVLIPSLSNGAKLKAEKVTSNVVENDITGSKRNVFIAGAYNLANKTLPEALTMQVGPKNWKPIVAPLKKVSGQIIEVSPGTGTLRKALKSAYAGAILQLKPGEYIVEKGIKIANNVTITGIDETDKPIIKVKDNLEKTPNYIFRVTEGNTLKLTNLKISGNNSTPIKYAIVSPDKGVSLPYSVFIDNCHIYDFKNQKGGSILKAYKGTIADTIHIANSKLENSFRGVHLASEKDNIGKFNAKTVIIDNTIFKNIEEWALNYYRGGYESLKGGNLLVNHCIFSNVANKEKGRILKTNGITTVEIKNSVFEKGYKITEPLNLSGIKNTITNCLLFNVGTIKISNGARQKEIYYKNPKWEDKDNFRPSAKSPLIKNADATKQIGLNFKLKK